MNGKKVAEFRDEPITLALWENKVKIEGETCVLSNITIVRWAGKKGAWKTVHNFRAVDLPRIANVIQQYQDEYLNHEDTPNEEEEPED